ncbi:MAG: GntR family transcriptional regulator [Verrucomicrobiota bacterium]
MNKHLSTRRGTAGTLRGVNPADPVPLHAQIERELRRMIALARFQNGALLPDEQTLANRFGVSRGTVRVALTRLVQQHLLERKAGIGTRVCLGRPAESGIGAWRSFSREMAGKSIQVVNFRQNYALVEASPEAARALQIRRGTRVHRLDRLRGWDGLPVLHSRSWFHPRLGLTGREEFSQPLYEVVAAETGAVVGHAHEEFTAVVAAALMAKKLQVKRGEALLLRRHTVFDTGNRPMEFAEVHYVSTRFTLTLDLKREVS